MALANLLNEVFEIEIGKAKEAEEKLTIEEFERNFGKLEGILGFDNAALVVKNGDFLKYHNGTFDDYFNLAIHVAGQISYPVPSENIENFYSIDNLNKFFKPPKESKIDSSKLQLARYRIVHKDNDKSAYYLNSLIETGSISTADHEHWCTSSRNETGPRGLNILKRIVYELKIMFSDLGLEEPNCDLNYGQRLLQVGEKEIDLLREIRTEAYKLQKN